MMDKAELRAALKKAEDKPRSCVIGLAKSKEAFILLDLHKAPRKLLSEARSLGQAGPLALDMGSLRFGRVSARGAAADYVVNKPVAPAMQQAMKAPMRAAGFPQFTINADPALEQEPDEQDGPCPSAPSPAPPLGAEEGSSVPGAPSSGNDALKDELRTVLEQVRPAIAADPSRRELLLKLALKAGDRFHAGDLAGTKAGIEALRQALPANGPAPPGATSPGTVAPQGAALAPPPPAPTQDTPTTQAPPAQPATTLAATLHIDPSTFAGKEDAAARVMARLQKLRTLPERERTHFGEFVADQGFPPGTAFFQACQKLAANTAAGLPDAWTPGMDPDPASLRLGQAVKLAAKKAPAALGAKLLELAQPRNLAIVATMSAAFALLQAAPAGWLLDALLAAGLIVAGGLTIAEVYAALQDVAAFYKLVQDPAGDLDEAADHLVAAATRLGVDVLVALALHKAGELAKTIPKDGGGPPMVLQPALAGGARLPATAAASQPLPEAITGPGLTPLPAMLAHQKQDGPNTPPDNPSPARGGPGTTPGEAAPRSPSAPTGDPTPLPMPPPTPSLTPSPEPSGTRPSPAQPGWQGGRLRPDQQRELAGIEPTDAKEAEFAAHLAEQGAKHDEITRQLDKLRNGGFGPKDRNAGLREALQSDSGRSRDAAIREDKPIQDALAAGRITREELVAHHLIPMEAVKKYPAVFGPAADAGWRPDAASNVVMLPRNPTAQQHLAANPNGTSRPYHDNPHGRWNEAAARRIVEIQSELENLYAKGTPEFGTAARRMLEDVSKDLRKKLSIDRVTMRQDQQPEFG